MYQANLQHKTKANLKRLWYNMQHSILSLGMSKQTGVTCTPHAQMICRVQNTKRGALCAHMLGWTALDFSKCVSFLALEVSQNSLFQQDRDTFVHIIIPFRQPAFTLTHLARKATEFCIQITHPYCSLYTWRWSAIHTLYIYVPWVSSPLLPQYC